MVRSNGIAMIYPDFSSQCTSWKRCPNPMGNHNPPGIIQKLAVFHNQSTIIDQLYQFHYIIFPDCVWFKPLFLILQSPEDKQSTRVYFYVFLIGDVKSPESFTAPSFRYKTSVYKWFPPRFPMFSWLKYGESCDFCTPPRRRGRCTRKGPQVVGPRGKLACERSVAIL